jgi:hypothetical protein
MAQARIAAKVDGMPDDCSCPDGFPPVNLAGIMALFGCAACGGFAVSMTADLDGMIEMLQNMKDTRDKGLPVVHPASQVTAVRLGP